MSLYTIVLNIHIFTAISLVGLVLYSDHLGWGWLSGKHSVLPAPKLKLLHRSIYAGLAIMFTTGLYMYWPLQSYLLSNTPFLVKMSLLLTLLINSYFVGKLAAVSSEKPFALLEKRDRVPFYVSGAISTFCWVGIIVAAINIGL